MYCSRPRCEAINAEWDGKLGSKGAHYQRGLPSNCGLTIATSVGNIIIII